MEQEYVPGKMALYWLNLIAAEGGETYIPDTYKGLPWGWAIYSLINNGYVEICGFEPGAKKYRLRGKGRQYMKDTHGLEPVRDEELF